MAKPTIVIVQGAWHVPQHYALLKDRLQDAGFEVYVPRILSSGDVTGQTTLADDVGVVQKLLHDLADAGKMTIVLAHSYGGIIATDAVQELSREQRKSKGLQGGVIHMIYMCAYMVQVGESVATASRVPKQVPDPVERSADGIGTVIDTKQLFYNDIDDQTAKEYMSLILPQALRPFIGTVSFPAWQYIPTTYLKCTEDVALLPAWQDNFIRAAQEKADIEVHTLKSGHSPFITLPGEIVNIVQSVTAKYEKTVAAAL